MNITYKLTRLEDHNDRVNWKITPLTDVYAYIRWDMGKIEKYASELEVGESKIIEV